MDANLPSQWLYSEFQKRQQRNPKYSLRSFAQALKIPSGRLSQIFSGKRHLTPALGRQVAERLAMSPEQKALWLEKIHKQRKARFKKAQELEPIAFDTLDMDHFHTISEPYHMDLLSLIQIKGFNSESSWIAKTLKISTQQVEQALGRLERLGLIKRSGNKIVVTQVQLTTSHDVSSPALRHAHTRVLQQAIDSLEQIPVHQRDITSMTMAIDPARLPEAKRRIAQFRRRLCAFLEEGEKKAVYRINLQLIPTVQKIDPEQGEVE